MQLYPPPIFWLTIGLAIVLTACGASTKIVNQWVQPDYTAHSFRKIMIIGVSKQPSIRRTFEDEFVKQLKAVGVDAVPSYLYIPEAGQVTEGRLQEAVKRANADGVMITRLVRVEKKTQVTPGFYQPAPALSYGFYGGYSSAWMGYYEPPRVYQYDVYVSETTLYNTAQNQLVWTGTAETTDPGNINKEIAGYVNTVIDALKNKNLLAT